MKEKKEYKIKREAAKKLKYQMKKSDIFLNLGTFMKYSGLLDLKDSGEVNCITVLMPRYLCLI